MAVVAFPFSTCFTSEDIEDGGSLQHFAVSDRDGKPLSSSLEAGDSQEQSCSKAGAPAEPSSDPSGQIKPKTDDEMIDDAFEAELEDDEKCEETGDAKSDETNQVMETQETTSATSIGYKKDEKDQQEMETTTAEVEAETKTVDIYGGLSNLGNTCFLNSALQMVASLDGFTEELNNTLPSGDGDKCADDAESQRPNLKLRLAFLDVMASLERGENISPTEFKQALDERTPLFLGYQQQDAHEALTTLFDLLDADYKVKDAEAKRDEDNNNCNEESKEDEADTNDIEHSKNDDDKSSDDNDREANESALASGEPPVQTAEEDETASDINKLVEGAEGTSSEDTAESPSLESYESALKRPRGLDTEVDGLTIGNPLREARMHGTGQSFSDMKPEGIEALLNARLLVNNTLSGHDGVFTAPSPPRCKLAGGRMPASEANGTVLFCDTDASMSSASIDMPRQDQDGGSAETALSPIESYLQTEVRVRLTCESCKYTRCHPENYLHLSLEIPDNENLSGNIADGLRKFFAPEKREIKCEKCFHESALQTMEITRLPRALLLHFKRFIVDISDDYTSIKYRKNRTDVDFTETLDFDNILSEFVADDFSFPKELEDDSETAWNGCTYNIRSVVNHIGASAACGHYTADAFRSYSGGLRRWNRFNDSSVSHISSEMAIRDSARTAYMVMYELSQE